MCDMILRRLTISYANIQTITIFLLVFPFFSTFHWFVPYTSHQFIQDKFFLGRTLNPRPDTQIVHQAW